CAVHDLIGRVPTDGVAQPGRRAGRWYGALRARAGSAVSRPGPPPGTLREHLSDFGLPADLSTSDLVALLVDRVVGQAVPDLPHGCGGRAGVRGRRTGRRRAAGAPRGERPEKGGGG